MVDPTWSGAGRLAFGRTGHTATLLGSGQVPIAGGRVDDDAKSMTAELYDPATGRFTAAATLMKAARAQHTARTTARSALPCEPSTRALVSGIAASARMPT